MITENTIGSIIAIIGVVLYLAIREIEFWKHIYK